MNSSKSLNVTPGSYIAIELMRKGVNFDNLPLITKHVEILSSLSSKANQIFYDDCFLNICHNQDVFFEINILSQLKKNDIDASLVNFTSLFKPFYDHIMDASNEETGLNAYIGNLLGERLMIFLLRSMDVLAGKYTDVFTKSLARKQAAKVILLSLSETINSYDKKWMVDDEKQNKLLEKIKKEKPTFPVDIKKSIDINIKQARTFYTELSKIIVNTSGSFSSGKSPEEMCDVVVSDALNILARDSAAGFAAKGVRVHGIEKFLERASSCDMDVRERRFSQNRRVSLLARLASGEGLIDTRFLVYVDPKNPFTYDVPKELQKKIKIQSLAFKMLRSKKTVKELGEEVSDLVKKHSIMSCVGKYNSEIPLSLFCMVGRGLIAGEIYGEETKGYEAYKKLKEIQPNGHAPIL